MVDDGCIEYGAMIDDDRDRKECKAVIYVDDDPRKNIWAESRVGGLARMTLAEKGKSPNVDRRTVGRLLLHLRELSLIECAPARIGMCRWMVKCE